MFLAVVVVVVGSSEQDHPCTTLPKCSHKGTAEIVAESRAPVVWGASYLPWDAPTTEEELSFSSPTLPPTPSFFFRRDAKL